MILRHQRKAVWPLRSSHRRTHLSLTPCTRPCQPERGTDGAHTQRAGTETTMGDPPPPLPPPHEIGARAAAAAAAALAMPPPPARPPASGLPSLPPPPPLPQAVLGEEAYLHAMASIVERDYFPDVPRLQSRLEWLAAGDDPVALAGAQCRAAARRAGARVPLLAGGGGAGRGGAAAWAATPATGTPDARLGGETPAGWDEGEEEVEEEGRVAPALPPPPLSLDAFLSAHTSEDNAAFTALAAKDAARSRAMAARRTGGGGGGSGAGSTLFLGAGTGAALALPAPPGAAPGPASRPPPPRAAATRLGGAASAAAGGSPGTSLAGSSTPGGWSSGSGAGGSLPPGGWPPDRGGSVEPGARPDSLLASPLVTWGELAATPVRLDGGSGFRVAGPGPREALARRAGGGGRGGLSVAPPSARAGGPAGTPLRVAPGAMPSHLRHHPLGVRGGGVGRLGTALRAAAAARGAGGGGGTPAPADDSFGLRSTYATPVRGRSVTPAVPPSARATPDVRGRGGVGVNTDGLLDL